MGSDDARGYILKESVRETHSATVRLAN